MNVVYLHRMACEELDGAREYIMKAARIKEEDPSFAKTFANMSAEELGHASKLYDMAVDLIKDMKKNASEDALKILEDLHEVIADDFDERYSMVKNLQTDFDR